jgi:hypothetical protein
MQLSDFNGIRYFTAEEVEATGAKIEDVQENTIITIDRLRAELGRPIKLVRNGITTGKHSSHRHYNGNAIDFTIDGLSHKEAVQVALLMASVGFRGIGVYFNGSSYSFHGDFRANLTTWFGVKAGYGKEWSYKALQFDRR